jgi:hypothetical protein
VVAYEGEKAPSTEVKKSLTTAAATTAADGDKDAGSDARTFFYTTSRKNRRPRIFCGMTHCHKPPGRYS